MNKKILGAVAAMALGLVSCGQKQETRVTEVEGTARTALTEQLLTNLKTMPSQGYMYGRHDDPVYGHGWAWDEDRSDVKSVCGDLPAVMSFDLGHIELGDTVNLDGVPFNRIRREVIKQFEAGGMVTFSWHLNNPLTKGTAWVEKTDELIEQEKATVGSVLEGGECHELFIGWLDKVADFMNSLTTADGTKVPVLFRPWHEHTGSWFWWGQDLCSTDQYKALWQMTYDELKSKGVDNVLYAYSPGTENGGDAVKYMERYPGDEIIDLLGLDCYCNAEPGVTDRFDRFTNQLQTQLPMIVELAKQHDKAVALTETGFEGIPLADWWTSILQPAIGDNPICYVLTWRNAYDRDTHYFGPFPGQISADDFVKFYESPKTIFLKDLKNLYK